MLLNYKITITLLQFLKSSFNLFQTPNLKRAYPLKIEASLFCFSFKRKQQSSPYLTDIFAAHQPIPRGMLSYLILFLYSYVVVISRYIGQYIYNNTDHASYLEPLICLVKVAGIIIL